MPVGKQWLHVYASSDFRVGGALSGSADCKVLEVQEDAIKVAAKLSRREAAGLEKVEVSLDPNVWAGAFFKGRLFGREKVS